MRPLPRALLAVAAAAGVLAGVAWLLVPAPLAVDVAAVRRGPLRVTVDEEGRTRVKERYVVSAPLAGRVSRCELHAGDGVVAGRTALFVLEPADPELLDPRERAQAQARERAAATTVELAAPVLERAQTAWRFAQTGLARARKLFEAQTLSRRELDEAEERERLAAQDVSAAQFAAQVAGFELELARAALLRPGPDGAGDECWSLTLVAPVDGRVLRVFQESAAPVAAGAPLIELGDPRELEIMIEMLSTDAVRVAPGSPVVLDRWGGEGPLHARVRVVEPGAFTKVSALGVEEQRTRVVADLVETAVERASLGDAFRVEAHVVVWEGDDLLLAPIGALFRPARAAADADASASEDRESAWAVFVVARGRAALRRVEVGHRGDRAVEVLSGLSEGETVVLYPTDRVADGARVRPR